MKPAVTLYTRAGCHLCERVEALLAQARQEAPFELTVADIDRDPALKARYDHEVPVVSVDGADLFHHAMDYAAFLARVRKSQ
ncbi:MAG: glutaredoxin family protein [Bryobacteraceae bacterium]